MADKYIILQKETITKVVKILKNNKNVLGCLLVGSVGIEKNDVFSDIDLICFLKNEEKIGREEIFSQVANIYKVLSKLYLYDKFALYLYENGIRLDLDFYKSSEVKPIDKNNAKILYDPESFLIKHLSDKVIEKSPMPKWNDNEGDLEEWFLWMFRQVYSWSRRAELNKIKSFDKLLTSYNSLSEVRNKLLDIKRFMMKKRDYIQADDPQFTERISKTFPSFNAKSIIEANAKLLNEFELLMPLYYNQISKIYSKEKVEKLKDILNEFAKL